MAKKQKSGSDKSIPSKKDRGRIKPQVNNDAGDTVIRKKRDDSGGTSSGGPRKK